MLQGADGAYYGMINVFGELAQESGLCAFRTSNLADPKAYKGWSGQAFDIDWHSAYSNASSLAQLCPPLPSSQGNGHPCPRQLLDMGVPNQPKYMLFGQTAVDSQLGYARYAFSNESTFDKAVTSWNNYTTLDFGLERYIKYNAHIIYAVVLDNESPEHTQDLGLGDNYELVGNNSAYVYINELGSLLRIRVTFSTQAPAPTPAPTPPAPAPRDCQAFQVLGAGMDGVNGIYNITRRVADNRPVFEKDASHQLYSMSGQWRLGYEEVAVFYKPLALNTTMPPYSYWRYTSFGAAPNPVGVLCLTSLAVDVGVRVAP